MRNYRAARYFIALIIALVIGGCAVAPPEKVVAPSESELVRKAGQALQRADYEAAARHYLDAADIAPDESRADYQLLALSALLRGNHIASAQLVLEQIDIAGLDLLGEFRWRAGSARIALAQNRPEQALNVLPAATPDGIPDALRAEVHELRAEARHRTGNLLESAREHVLRDGFLRPDDTGERARSQQAIWLALNQLPDEVLRRELAPPPDPFDGWRELALIARSAQTGAVDIQGMIDGWQRRYPAHPASADIIELVLARQREQAGRPMRIAVLLPHSGPVAEIADALRDGFIAAHFHRENRAYSPEIRFYDTGPDPATVTLTYRQAIEDGADFVVGPLTRQGVTNLADSGHIGVPTLALNYSDSTRRSDPMLFQFGLAPEDEARQVAQRAWLDGHNHALAIVPEDEWGERVAAAFRKDWEQFGGKLLEIETYPPGINDFSDQIRRLLNLDESEQRHRELARVLQQPLQHEPRRRQDADFIFMAAFPRQARLIRPQLEFHFAAELPVYSTSHVFTGHRNREDDRDIDGVIFCDLPWVLTDANLAIKRDIERVWPERSAQYARFYALGVDAYDIIPYLNNLRLFHYERFQGATGVLQLSDTNRIYRQLPWARFSNGLPRPYN
jgi:uncharacterized protein